MKYFERFLLLQIGHLTLIFDFFLKPLFTILTQPNDRNKKFPTYPPFTYFISYTYKHPLSDLGDTMDTMVQVISVY